VRGTPQQIIDKYNQLARDAQLGNDRVAFENFQQHAEHYLRMLAEAQREMDARRDQQQQGGQGQSAARWAARRASRAAGTTGSRRPEHPSKNGRPAGAQGDAKPQNDAAAGGDSRGFDEVIDQPGADNSTLVETPENAPKPRRSRSRRPRKADGDAPEPLRMRRPMRPPAPKGDDGGPSHEAAE
jgi:hypothetical protein